MELKRDGWAPHTAGADVPAIMRQELLSVAGVTALRQYGLGKHQVVDQIFSDMHIRTRNWTRIRTRI